MHRYLLTTILIMLLSMNAWSQEQEPGTEAGTESGDEANTAEPAAEDEVEPEVDDSDLDQGSYADAEEEDFVPTEDIPTDQSIPFPTDI